MKTPEELVKCINVIKERKVAVNCPTFEDSKLFLNTIEIINGKKQILDDEKTYNSETSYTVANNSLRNKNDISVFLTIDLKKRFLDIHNYIVIDFNTFNYLDELNYFYLKKNKVFDFNKLNTIKKEYIEYKKINNIRINNINNINLINFGLSI